MQAQQPAGGDLGKSAVTWALTHMETAERALQPQADGGLLGKAALRWAVMHKETKERAL